MWSTPNGSDTLNLLNKIKSENPTGMTALYPAAIKALEAGKDGYYAKEGFWVVSGEFLEDGIPHVKMERGRDL